MTLQDINMRAIAAGAFSFFISFDHELNEKVHNFVLFSTTKIINSDHKFRITFVRQKLCLQYYEENN